MQQQAEAVDSERVSTSSPDLQAIESRTKQIGQRIFEQARRSRASVFEKNFWQTKMMELSMKYPEVKTQLFRFVDVLPVLKTDEQKYQHLLEYLSPPPNVKRWPWSLKLISYLLRLPGLKSFWVRFSERQVAQMGDMFIIGRTAEEVLPKIRALRQDRIAFTLDVLGEAVCSDREAEEYQQHYLSLMSALAKDSSPWVQDPLIDVSASGSTPKVNISVKVSALDPLMDPMAPESSLRRLEKRMEPILQKAMIEGLFVNFDMEQFSTKNLTRDLFKKMLLKEEFRHYRHFGIVLQAYLRDAKQDAEDWINFAKKRGTPFTIRLVKGAYWDYETIIADQNHWERPVYSEKWESDACFEDCCHLILENYPDIELAVGSHNIRSLSYALATAESLGVPKNGLEVQMLYGMSGPFKKAFINDGCRVREYCPMGEMLPGLSYLVRRLLENTANDSFLKQGFLDKRGVESLLQKPSAN